MNKTIEYNRSLLNKKKGLFSLREAYIRERKTILKHKEATPEQIKAIKARVIQSRRRQIIKSLVALVLALLLGSAVLSGLAYWTYHWF